MADPERLNLKVWKQPVGGGPGIRLFHAAASSQAAPFHRRRFPRRPWLAVRPWIERFGHLPRLPYLLVTTAPPATVTSTNDIRPLKPLWHIPQPWVWFWWILALLLASLLAYYLWRRRRARPQESAPEIVIPPHERALARLEKALELIGQPKPFTIEVSDTVRFYLEERFSFHAPERTTEEFLNELQSTARLSADQKQSLGRFLQNCDLVKFARYEPGPSELRQLHESARQLVRETAPTAPATVVPTPASDSSS